jgi:transcriptional regulator with XRE-family HTH domain
MNKTLGQHIKDLRRGKGLNQSELGTLCGVSQTTVSAWERDDDSPSAGNLVTLANALGVEPEILSAVETVAPILRPSLRDQIFQRAHPSTQTARPQRESVPFFARKAIGDQFEKEVAELLDEAKIAGNWHQTERAPNGIQWEPDLQTDKVVVEFKLVDSRTQMSLQTLLAASMWRMMTMRAHLKDSRSYAVIIHSLPDQDGQPQVENDQAEEQKLRRPSTAARLHRLQAEAALVGMSLYVVTTPIEAAEIIMAMEHPGWADFDEV